MGPPYPGGTPHTCAVDSRCTGEGMSYRIEADKDRMVIYCLRCGGNSDNPSDIKLRNCPSCGYHCVFPAGMGGLLAGVDGVGSLGSLGSGPLVVAEDNQPEE